MGLLIAHFVQPNNLEGAMNNEQCAMGNGSLRNRKLQIWNIWNRQLAIARVQALLLPPCQHLVGQAQHGGGVDPE
ncbi:MAG TPA: hypothetical protein VNH84_13030, partial [Candidatus Saccharimonadales bacterium]|nr:hypothetical protein [Candidatus Saccharimonadales bacterium]